MSQFPMMPLFLDAYLGDTTHLSTEEHGAYLLLLMAMWRRDGTVPDDDKDNARIVGLSLQKWRHIKARLLPFLTLENGFLTQNRLKKERAYAKQKSEIASQNGSKGGRPKTNKNNNITKAEGSPQPNPEESSYPYPYPYPSSVSNETSEKESPSGVAVATKGRIVLPDKVAASPERELFAYGKRLLGRDAGGIIVKLRKACEFDDAYAMELLREASTKENPKEWICAVIRNSTEVGRMMRGLSEKYSGPIAKTKEEREFDDAWRKALRGAL